MNRETTSPLLAVLSGPSGVGKDALLIKLRGAKTKFYSPVTVTTRPKRPKEKDGVDYHFVSDERFEEMKFQGELLEWAMVYDYNYGVPKSHVKELLAAEHDVIIKVDVQGAVNIKRIWSEAILIFLAPPCMEELKRRITHRKTESSDVLQLRLKKAEEEMQSQSLFDYVVVNYEDRLLQAVEEIDAIAIAEKCKVKPRVFDLDRC